MIQTVFNGMIAILMARFFLNDLPHAAGVLDNPGRRFPEPPQRPRKHLPEPVARVVTVPGGSRWQCLECRKMLEAGGEAVKIGARVYCVECARGGNPGNPGNPGDFGAETETIMTRAGLGEYKPPPFGVFVERDEGAIRRRKPPSSIRTRDIWIYRVVMEKRGNNCRIKLYEYISGRGDKLRATWSGEGAYCDVKFEQISGVVRQVEFEYKTAMRTTFR